MTTTWGSHYPYHITIPVNGRSATMLAYDIGVWMKETFPDLVESNWDRQGDWYVRWTGTDIEISFRCPTQATMCKLAWGGK